MTKVRFLLAAACLSLWAGAYAQEEPQERQAATQRVKSPIVNADRSVTVQIKSPKAQEAVLDFYVTGKSVSIPMKKDAGGMWKATTEPLEPGLHYYHIALDGVPIWDPGCTWFKGYSKTEMCLVDVPGDQPPIYAIRPDVPHGVLTHERFASKVTKDLRGINVYTPPSYRDSDKKYPVLYLLHGAGGDETRWVDVGLIDRILDNWIADGVVNELVVVITSNRLGRDVSLEDYFLNELMPHVEKHYRVLTDKKDTAVAGFSMGGGQAFQLAFKHPERFGAVCSLSGAIHRENEMEKHEILKDAEKTNAAFNQLYVTACDSDNLSAAAKALHEEFDKAGIKHVYLTGPGGHAYKDDWKYLVKYLSDFTGVKKTIAAN